MRLQGVYSILRCDCWFYVNEHLTYNSRNISSPERRAKRRWRPKSDKVFILWFDKDGVEASRGEFISKLWNPCRRVESNHLSIGRGGMAPQGHDNTAVTACYKFLSFHFFNLVVEARITVYTRCCHLSDQKSGCISIKFTGNRAKTPSHAFTPGPWWCCVYRAKHARDLFRLFCLLLLCMCYAIVSSK